MKSFAIVHFCGILLLSQAACYMGSNIDSRHEDGKEKFFSTSNQSNSWANVLQLNADDRVIVALNNGQKIKGKVKITTSQHIKLAISAREEKLIERSMVSQIEKLHKDRLANGILIGAAFGAGAWGVRELIKSMDNDQPEPEPPSRNGERDPNIYIPDLNPFDDEDPAETLFLFSATGAEAGFLLDWALKQKILIYQAKADTVKSPNQDLIR